MPVTFETKDGSTIYNLDNLPDSLVNELASIQKILQNSLQNKFKYIDIDSARNNLSPKYKLTYLSRNRTMNSIDPAALQDEVDGLMREGFYQQIEVVNGFNVMFGLMSDTINNQESSYKGSFFESSYQSEGKYFSYGFTFYSKSTSSYCFLVITLISFKNQKIIFGIPQKLNSGISWNVQVLKINDDTTRDYITSPSRLNANDSIVSSNQFFKATMQADGNFVLYNKGMTAIWSTGTVDKGSYITIQDDGNLVVYDNNGKPTWASDSNGSGRHPFKLYVTNDGRLIIQDDGLRSIWRV